MTAATPKNQPAAKLRRAVLAPHALTTAFAGCWLVVTMFRARARINH
jgi:hypothetical protein